MLEGRIYKLLAGTYYVDTPMGAMAAKAKGSFRSESVLPREEIAYDWRAAAEHTVYAKFFRAGTACCGQWFQMLTDW